MITLMEIVKETDLIKKNPLYSFKTALFSPSVTPQLLQVFPSAVLLLDWTLFFFFEEKAPGRAPLVCFQSKQPN